MSILGNRVLRREDPRLLSGGRFVDDIPAEGALWVHYVRSSIAHARLLAVDVSEALAAPGVVGVYTAADLDIGPVAHIVPSYPPGMARPVLAGDVVRYVGEPVAAVVAESKYLAADAADLVVVDYDPLPPVIDPEYAATDAVLLFPEVGTNTVMTFASPAEADFAGCEVVVRLRVDNTRMNAAPIEPRSGLASWSADGRLTLYSSCQGAHPTRDALAKLYGLEPGQVRVIVPDMGGGFGAKSRTAAESLALGWFARRHGRPCRWTETRSENMVSMPHGRGQLQYVTIGGTRDGRVTAYKVDAVAQSGAYPLMGAMLPGMTQRMLCGVYDIANVGFSARSVATNTTSTTAFRGAGRPEAAVAIERAMDAFAAEIGMDPAEVRRRNLIPRFTEAYTTGIGTAYDVGDYPEGLERVLKAADYSGLRAEQARRRASGDPVALGIGLSVYVEITGGGPSTEFADVALTAGGRIRVRAGGTPIGQGHETAWSMIVADRLGVALDAVDVIEGDTDLVPQGGMTVGSRSVQITGSSIADASAKLVQMARDRAAELLEANPDDLTFDSEAGRFCVVGTPAVFVDWAALADAGVEAGWDDSMLAVSDFSAPTPTYPFGAHLAVVEVDTVTGKAELRRIVALDDAGTLLSPLMADGQIHGGIAQGVAQALLEEIRYDESGNPLTTNFADYTVISAAELPSFELVHMETPTWANELGAKGVGESGTIGAIPAVQNAVIDALGHLGVRHLDMPLTPERVWRALHQTSV